MFFFIVLVIPCALATSLPELIIVRFLGALAGSAMIANAPGTISDIVNDEYRALAFSVWSIGPLNGPVFGPIIGGFVTQYLGWRWTNWTVAICAGVAWVPLLLMKETYAPALLKKKARQRRAETDDSRWWSRYDQRVAFWGLLRLNLSRPLIMAVKEPICIFWNVYMAYVIPIPSILRLTDFEKRIIYGILYLCFVAYPIVFQGARGWSNSESGLAFLGIGVVCHEPIHQTWQVLTPRRERCALSDSNLQFVA